MLVRPDPGAPVALSLSLSGRRVVTAVCLASPPHAEGVDYAQALPRPTPPLMASFEIAAATVC